MPIPFLHANDDITPFPPVEQALPEPNGLLMAGGNLSPARLMTAYRCGVFPWYEEGEPILWWSPDPRCILWPNNIRVRRSLAKTIRKGHLKVTENEAFEQVVLRCASPRAGSTGTWITDAISEAYTRLHRLGFAKSIEIWQNDSLVGGLYGVQVGEIFIGESMFSQVSDASKIAMVHLARYGGHQLIDCQLSTPHLESMGAEQISRSDYLDLLQQLGDLSSRMFAPASERNIVYYG